MTEKRKIVRAIFIGQTALYALFSWINWDIFWLSDIGDWKKPDRFLFLCLVGVVSLGAAVVVSKKLREKL